jgi:hypothetical protein
MRSGIMHEGQYVLLIAKYYRLPVDPLLIFLAVFAIAATVYVVRSILKNRRR